MGPRTDQIGPRAVRFDQLQSPLSFQIRTLLQAWHVSRTKDYAQGREDEPFILKAALFSIFAHHGKTRTISKQPYATHSIGVAMILICELKINDPDMIATALLHDVVEDTFFDIEFIKREFGPVVAWLVDGMTKIAERERDPDRYINRENIDKYIKLLILDIRIQLIKTADRIHNLRDGKLSEESCIRNSTEAIEMYVPGDIFFGFLKGARLLADIALQNYMPAFYNKCANTIADWKTTYDSILTQLEAKLKTFSKEIIVERKFITPYEMFLMTTGQQKGAEELTENITLVIKTSSIEDCSSLILFIHGLGTPYNYKMRDYISDPKSSGAQNFQLGITYQGLSIRILLMTHEMAEAAEYGLAHRSYVNGQYIQPRHPKHPELTLPEQAEEILRAILLEPNRHKKRAQFRELPSIKNISAKIDNQEPIIFLAPRRINALEAACFIDPKLVFQLIKAYHDRRLIGLDQKAYRASEFEFATSASFQVRDYLTLITNPIARAIFINYLQKMTEPERIEKFSYPLLDYFLKEIYLSVDSASASFPLEIRKLLLEMAAGEKTAAEAVESVKNLIKKGKGDPLKYIRVEISTDDDTLRSLEDRLTDLFLITNHDKRGNSIRLSIPITCPEQEFQLNHALRVACGQYSHMTLHRSEITPKIFDLKTLDFDSIFYVGSIAQQTAQAIVEQAGKVFDISLNPPAGSFLFDSARMNNDISAARMVRDIESLLREHIGSSGILFINGIKGDLDLFRQALMGILKNQSMHIPLMALIEHNDGSGPPNLLPILSKLLKQYDLPLEIYLTELGLTR